MTKKAHLQCGARTRAGGSCKCKRLPGKRRCRFHGGASTGPRTQAGKAKTAKNLEKANSVRLAMPSEWHRANAQKAAATRAQNRRPKESRMSLEKMKSLGTHVRHHE